MIKEELTMAVRETIQSPEQKSREQAMQAQGEKEFASKLADSMDLPSTLTGAINQQAEENQKPVVEEEVTEEELQDEQNEQTEETEHSEEEQPAETEEKPLEEEEDLIPKSKVQKRINEMTREKRELEARLRKLEEQAQAPKSDSQLEALEKMSADELRTLKRQVRVEQIKAGTDEAKLAQFLDLEEKIDRTIQTAPQRFVQTQTARFNDAVRQSSEEIEDFDKVKSDIYNYANTIYSSSPELQGSVAGQERAWKFAVDHFNALRKVSEGKSDTNELKRQVNTLKKKISVDSPSKKTTQQPDSMAKLHRKAVDGTDADKMRFFKRRMNTDSLVSEEELRAIEGVRR